MTTDAVLPAEGADGADDTDGPYAETTEQLTGFYLVETGDLADLLDVIDSTLGRAEQAVEVRECRGDEGG